MSKINLWFRKSIFLVMLIILTSQVSVSGFSGGSGTPDDPYQLATAADLLELGGNTTYYNKCFIMTSDIDMAGRTFTQAVIAPWSNSNINKMSFSGTFNGDYHTISGLTISGDGSCGIFGHVSEGKISNLGVENIVITSSYYAGGLVGSCVLATITNCSVNGKFTGSECAGGLAGYSSSGIISGCHTAVVLSGGYMGVGGLVGYSSCDVISNCYVSGELHGDVTGGFIGIIDSSNLSNCYTIAKTVAGIYSDACGFAAYSTSQTVTNCFWDTQASGTMCAGMSDSGYYIPGVTGLDTAAMQSIDTFLAAGWDFSTDDGDAADWKLPTNWYPVLSWETITTFAMPDLAGMTELQAKTIVENLGFKYVVNQYVDSDTIPGYLCDQEPQAGTTVTVSTQITLSFSLGKKYSGGSGTSTRPYILTTVDDLLELGNSSTDYDKYFILTADIDLSGQNFTSAPLAGSSVFSGNFNGNGHVISGLKINGTSNCGLFGKLGGTVYDLGLKNVDIITSGNNAGALAAETSNSCSVFRCYATGSLRSKSKAGGLIGTMLNSNLVNSYSFCSVISNSSGGLAGASTNSIIKYCYAAGIVYNATYCGGLVGSNSSTAFTGCFWDTDISGRKKATDTDNNTGTTGITGEQITNTTFTNAGWDFSDYDGDAADWKVCADCYPVLNWEATSVMGYMPDLAGLIKNRAIDKIQSLGLKYIIIYEYSNTTYRDFVIRQYPVANTPYTGRMPVKLVVSKGSIFSGGDGTEAKPYKINSAADLQELPSNIELYDKYFILTADIDLAGKSFTHAVIAYDFGHIGQDFSGKVFTGNFNGNGHVISNLKIDGGSYCGLFGRVNNAKIYNLGIENAIINASGFYAGGLVGYCDFGSITNCYSTGTINANKYAGGLAGYATNASIANCYSLGSVSANDYVGGLIGKKNYPCSISNCYSAGTITPNENMFGGFSGYGYGYGFTSCFWDTQTSGVAIGDGGEGNSPASGLTGLDTTALQDPNAFINAGWDIAIAPDDTRTWTMFCNSYPALSWEARFKKTVPSLHCVPEQIAIDTLQASGFGCKVVGYKYDNSPAGSIVSQNPSAGEQYYHRSQITVEVVISLGLKYSGGNGIESDPFLLGKAQDLIDLNNTPSDYSMYFELVNNIDMAGHNFEQAIIAGNTVSGPAYDGTKFTGHFNGNGFVISNINIYGDCYAGLFGYIDQQAVVCDLTISNANISGKCYLGSLAGYSAGAITNCRSHNITISGNQVAIPVGSSDIVGGLVGYSSGSITSCYTDIWICGDNQVGGLVGCSQGGNITNCSVNGTIFGLGSFGYVGGLIGYNHSTNITGCLTNTQVLGSSYYVGGLTGYNNNGIITNCCTGGYVSGMLYFVGGLSGMNNGGSISTSYTTTAVDGLKFVAALCGNQAGYNAMLADCFWDSDTCGTNDGYNIANNARHTSWNNHGLPTTEMTKPVNFTHANWDLSESDGDAADWRAKYDSYLMPGWYAHTPGDIAGDYLVDQTDLEYFASDWLAELELPADVPADINTDGQVDMVDFAILADNWLNCFWK